MLLLLAHKGVGLNKKNTYLTPPPTPLLPSRFYLIYSYFMASFLHHACPPGVFSLTGQSFLSVHALSYSLFRTFSATAVLCY